MKDVNLCNVHVKTLVAFLIPILLHGQDTRKVVEPSIPPACTVVKARIARAASSIEPENESKLDTVRIQTAIDGCAPGHAVVLQRSSDRLDAFLSGPLYLRRGVVLVVDRGTYLYASRNPRDYDIEGGAGVCGTITKNGGGCRALINGDDVPDSGVMGAGVIDGRGGEQMIGQQLSWWNLANRKRAGELQNNPYLIALNHCDDFTLYRITLMNSPFFHVYYNRGNGFTAWGVRIWSPARAENTDGIDPYSSTNVTIAHSYFHTGDDQVAIKSVAGAPATHMSLLHNHFYTGHGMSIGSEVTGGVSAIRVMDLSIDGADNGLRIKSNITRGGLVHDVQFEDVCIRDTGNPVFMDTHYTALMSPETGRPPTFRDILLRNVRVQGSGRVALEGLDTEHRLEIRFDNVWFDDPAKIRVSANHAEIQAGPGALNLELGGEDVQVTKTPGSSTRNACIGKFVDFPIK
jgi:polygalacturonase